MREAMETTERRRAVQEAYNKKYNIAPQPIQKEIREWFPTEDKKGGAFERRLEEKIREHKEEKRWLTELKKELEAEMLSAAAELDFENAATLRDMIQKLQ